MMTLKHSLMIGVALVLLGAGCSPQEVTTESQALPLGDGHLSVSPEVGSIFSCQTSFNGRGAQTTGPWVDAANGVWYPEEKDVVVDGSVSWPNASFAVNEANGTRTLTGNDLPTTGTTGTFPIQTTDDAYAIDRNPNSIKAQNVVIALPLHPTIAASPSCVGMGAIGYATNGVAIFNGLDAMGRDAAAHEIQDGCNGHPEHSGTYHYHDYSSCITGEDVTEPTLIGYALDGFGIYKLPIDPSDADLDACHGTTSVVPWNGSDQNIYHYVITAEYPYTIGCFMGTPVQR